MLSQIQWILAGSPDNWVCGIVKSRELKNATEIHEALPDGQVYETGTIVPDPDLVRVR